MFRKIHLLFLYLFLACCLHAATKQATAPPVPKMRVLIGAPIRQKPAILKEFLASLDRLEQNSYTADYFLIDDNVIAESHDLLQIFAQEKGARCTILPAPQKEKESQFVCDETTHHWTEDLVWKVAGFRNRIMDEARDQGYDHLFLIDSDVVVHPKTVEQLISTGKDIISNIFWTRWYPTAPLLPQVWLSDHYTQFHHEINEQLSQEEINKRHHAFLEQMEEPGTYEVGGLGGCTLISKGALRKGVNYKRIKSLTFWGEDRHFSVRASALGIPLYVDTHFPAYNIYRESDLAGVADYIRQCSEIAPKRHRLTLSMVVRNEADRYLRRVLQSAREYISDAVIIDDNSTDNTVQVIEEELKGIPLKIVRNKESKFSNEIELRKQQWEETVKTNPEWILSLDADQIFEDRFKNKVQRMLAARDADIYYFRWFDFWDEEHYRDDKFWCGHKNYYPMLVRYKPNMEYQWKETPLHCGHFPLTVLQFAGKTSDMRVKHYGWAKREDRETKAKRYKELDPDAKYGWKGQYDSILDEHPNLITWVE
jgi:Glycosyl transferase family 2